MEKDHQRAQFGVKNSIKGGLQSCPGLTSVPLAAMCDSGNPKPFHTAPPLCYGFEEKGFPGTSFCRTSPPPVLSNYFSLWMGITAGFRFLWLYHKRWTILQGQA